MDYAIETLHLTREFHTDEGVFKALEDINLKVREGIIFGLLGPNGAGKTTLIRILSTLLLPTSGEAYVDGFDVVKEANKVRKIINLVSGGERPGYGILTTEENLMYYAQIYGLSRREAKERIEEVNRLIGLDEFLHKRLNTLSTGMIQKYALARGLLNKPKILFLDEPTLGLDVENARIIRRLVRRLVDEGLIKTILLTSHYMAEVEELCDYIAIINKGRIIAEGTVEELKNMVSREVIYNIDVKAIETPKLEFLKNVDSVVGYTVRMSNISGEARIRIVMSYEDISRILDTLERNRIKILRIHQDRISLEDVFLKLVGRGLADD